MEKKSEMPDEDMNQQAKKKKKKDFEDFTINTRFWKQALRYNSQNKISHFHNIAMNLPMF